MHSWFPHRGISTGAIPLPPLILELLPYSRYSIITEWLNEMFEDFIFNQLAGKENWGTLGKVLNNEMPNGLLCHYSTPFSHFPWPRVAVTRQYINLIFNFIFQLQFTFNIILYYFQVYSIVIRKSWTLQNVPSTHLALYIVLKYWLYSQCCTLHSCDCFETTNCTSSSLHL